MPRQEFKLLFQRKEYLKKYDVEKSKFSKKIANNVIKYVISWGKMFGTRSSKYKSVKFLCIVHYLAPYSKMRVLKLASEWSLSFLYPEISFHVIKF